MGCNQSAQVKESTNAPGEAPADVAPTSAAPAPAATAAAPKKEASPVKEKQAAPATAAAPAVSSQFAEFDKLEAQIKATCTNKDDLDALWKALDFNGNGKVSLAEIDKMVVEKYPLLNNKPALMRAYKKTTLKDGDGDAWVERNELAALVRNLFYFNKLFKVFDGIDKDDDRRVDLAEFKKGTSLLGLKLSDAEAEAEFKKIDTNNGGLVLFDELCAWVARRQIPVDGEVVSTSTAADKTMGKSEEKPAATATAAPAAAPAPTGPSVSSQFAEFDKLEADIKALVGSKGNVDTLWTRLDVNGNGKVSLAEIDKLVVEKYPLLNNKPALMRAYKKTTLKDGDGDAWVERNELPALMRNLFYFNKLFKVFDGIDKDDDRRVDLAEFKKGASLLGLKLSDAEAEAEFAKVDTNGGGVILFDELCLWAARRHIAVDGDVMTSGTAADKAMGKSEEKPAAAATAAPAAAPEPPKKSEYDEKLDALEAELKAKLSKKAGAAAIWKALDENGNDLVSLAEIDKYVEQKYPLLNNKPALMRAYKKTTGKGSDGNAFVDKNELGALFRNLFYFNKLFKLFDGVDKDDDRRLDLAEFKKGASLLGLKLSDAQAEAEFKKMDGNDGNIVLFDEFCAWAAQKQMPVDD